jgi:8-amino-7-oxononanoate synthase
MLVSSLCRAPSTSSRTAQQKEYVFPARPLFFFLDPRLTTYSIYSSTQKLAAQVLENSTYLQERFRASLAASSIPSHILTLPQRQELSMAQLSSPIIPLMTPRARALYFHLLEHGINARPISWPGVPKGAERVRVCLHAGNTREQIDALVNTSIAWAAGIWKDERGGPEGGQTGIKGSVEGTGPSGGNMFQSKL